MFRYEARSFLAALESINDAHRELRMYEEQIRCLSSKWDSDPDVPVPRARLKRTLSKMEEREASLLILCRRLESISKLYEETEQRNTDLVDEMAVDERDGEQTTDAEPVPSGQEDTGSENEETSLSDLIGSYDVFPFPFILFPPRPNIRPDFTRILIWRIIRRLFRPFDYRRRLFWLVPPRRPRRRWPPRRPGGYLPFPDHRPVRWFAEWNEGKIRLLVSSAIPAHSMERQQRQQRIQKLFGER